MKPGQVEVGQTYWTNNGHFTVHTGRRVKRNEWSPSTIEFSGTLSVFDGKWNDTEASFVASDLRQIARPGWRQRAEENHRRDGARYELRKVAVDRLGFELDVHDSKAPIKAIEHLTKVIRRQAKVRFE